MKNKDIPRHRTGKALDYYKTIDFSSRQETDQFFDKIRHKVLHVNDWHRMTQGPSVEFRITDAAGNRVERAVKKGDRIRIDIPGPGLPSSQGYDWVTVEDLNEEYTSDYKKIAFTLRPCPDPTNTSGDTAHFFKAMATSTFLVEQRDKAIFLQYAGRNEVANTENESNWDNLRNFLIGTAAKLGASYPQWKALIDGLARVDK